MGARAHADAALLLEEPFGKFGDMNPTGHAAIYLDHVCAASPTELRICQPGEPGVVISRYHKIGGYDWIAIPLIPYLYAVDDPEEIPSYVDAKTELRLRDQYRRKHLIDIVPDDPKREIPDGEWVQLIGSAYDRKIYGYQIETTEQQDAALIEALNQQSNKSNFNLFFNNCANFAEKVLNFYYPHSIRRNFISDAGLMTPKQTARSLVHYSKRHNDLEFSAFVIPQVKGSIHRSSSVNGVIESLVKSKKYVLPIVALQPYVAAGLVAAYFGDGRFHPDLKTTVFDLAHELGPGMDESKPVEMPASISSSNLETAPASGGMHESHAP